MPNAVQYKLERKTGQTDAPAVVLLPLRREAPAARPTLPMQSYRIHYSSAPVIQMMKPEDFAVRGRQVAVTERDSFWHSPSRRQLALMAQTAPEEITGSTPNDELVLDGAPQSILMRLGWSGVTLLKRGADGKYYPVVSGNLFRKPPPRERHSPQEELSQQEGLSQQEQLPPPPLDYADYANWEFHPAVISGDAVDAVVTYAISTCAFVVLTTSDRLYIGIMHIDRHPSVLPIDRLVDEGSRPPWSYAFASILDDAEEKQRLTALLDQEHIPKVEILQRGNRIPEGVAEASDITEEQITQIGLRFTPRGTELFGSMGVENSSQIWAYFTTDGLTLVDFFLYMQTTCYSRLAPFKEVLIDAGKFSSLLDRGDKTPEELMELGAAHIKGNPNGFYARRARAVLKAPPKEFDAPFDPDRGTLTPLPR